MVSRRLLCSLLLLGACQARNETKDRLVATVSFLASDEMKGRQAGTPEGEKAARWMAAEFEKIGLRKALPGGYLQKFKTKGENSPDGFNVFGLLEGSGDELVALCCHHDHLGLREGKIHPGADDNASGCAVLLEVARLCASSPTKPRRGLLFCSFDAEESILAGSRYFVGSGAIDLTKITALVCMDMMGGNFFPRDTTSLYALGAENSPEIGEALSKIPQMEGLDVRTLGISVIEPFGEMFARSDYGSFRTKKVPFVFLSSGQPWTYHKPEDVVERLNLDKMARGVQFVHRLLLDLAALEARPRYVRRAGVTIDDLKAIAGIVKRFQEHPEDLEMKEEEIASLQKTMAQLDAIIQAGVITPKDGDTLQVVASTLMGLASRRPKGEK
ncbi:MAG: M28 family peptidase [Planctomycetes bacterium]|nr:M28 family peptidase [Planctomycetota bacterium]